jgi:hypothetical protein
MIGVLAILIATMVSSHRPAGAVIRPRWTRRAILSLGAHTDLVTLGSILGESESAVRQQHRAGKLPPGVVVLRVGRRWIVPTAPILELLGLGGGQQIRSASRDQVPSKRGEQPGDGKEAGTPTPAS